MVVCRSVRTEAVDCDAGHVSVKAVTERKADVACDQPAGGFGRAGVQYFAIYRDEEVASVALRSRVLSDDASFRGKAPNAAAATMTRHRFDMQFDSLSSFR